MCSPDAYCLFADDVMQITKHSSYRRIRKLIQFADNVDNKKNLYLSTDSTGWVASKTTIFFLIYSTTSFFIKPV